MDAIIRRFSRRFKARAVHAAFVSGFWPAGAPAVFTDFIRKTGFDFSAYNVFGMKNHAVYKEGAAVGFFNLWLEK